LTGKENGGAYIPKDLKMEWLTDGANGDTGGAKVPHSTDKLWQGFTTRRITLQAPRSERSYTSKQRYSGGSACDKDG